MHLWQHFIVSVILTLLVYPFAGIVSLFILIGGFLIDIDHILYYFVKFKKIEFNIKVVYNWFILVGKQKNKIEYINGLRPFHTIEIFVLLVILAFIANPFIFVLIGLIPHIIMDVLYEKKMFGHLQCFSLVRYLIKQKTL